MSAPDEAADRTPEQIEAEIEQTREDLGDTVAALSEKADVKARVKDKVEERKQAVVDKKDEVLGKAQGARDDLASKAQDASPSSIDPAKVVATAKETAVKPPVVAAGVFAAGVAVGVLIGRRRGS
jgi:chromosome segregation ATPase